MTLFTFCCHYFIEIKGLPTKKNNPKKYKEYVKKGKTEKTKGDYKRFNFCELRNHTAFFFLT